jgi:serine/alanine adding enzyme
MTARTTAGGRVRHRAIVRGRLRRTADQLEHPVRYGRSVSDMRVVRSLDAAPWAAFVDAHPAGSIFHTPEMHTVFEQTRNHRPSVWATVDAEDRILAMVNPVAVTTISGPLRSLTTRVVCFGGPLVAPGDTPGALDLLLGSYQEHARRSAVFTEFRNLIDATHLSSALTTRGFRHEGHLNFLVDLTAGEEQLWRQIAPPARRNVRAAQRAGVVVFEAQDCAEVAAGYAVLRAVYARLRVPLPDVSLFEAAQRVLRPLGRFTMLRAVLDGQTIGVLTLLLYKDVVYYWYTGTLRSHARARAGDLLVWHAIQLGHADGYGLLDFGGAGKPDETYGVRDFKAKYGGHLVDFGRDVWVQAPLRLRVATLGYQTVRRFL